MFGNRGINRSPSRTGLGVVFARLLGLKRVLPREERKQMNDYNSDRPRTTGTIFFAGTPTRTPAGSQRNDDGGTVITNPAPDASAPAVANGIIKEIKLG
jgi:hypothetical protein